MNRTATFIAAEAIETTWVLPGWLLYFQLDTCYFEPVTEELSDWMPSHEHFLRSKREGGHRDLDNAILGHGLCNRIDYSISGRGRGGETERSTNLIRDALPQAVTGRH